MQLWFEWNDYETTFQRGSVLVTVTCQNCPVLWPNLTAVKLVTDVFDGQNYENKRKKKTDFLKSTVHRDVFQAVKIWILKTKALTTHIQIFSKTFSSVVPLFTHQQCFRSLRWRFFKNAFQSAVFLCIQNGCLGKQVYACPLLFCEISMPLKQQLQTTGSYLVRTARLCARKSLNNCKWINN